MWEAALHGGLERKSATMDVPAPVFQLSVEEKAFSIFDRGPGELRATADVQGVKHFTSGVGIAFHRRQLTPAAIFVLHSQQFFCYSNFCLFAATAPMHSQQLKSKFLLLISLRLF